MEYSGLIMSFGKHLGEAIEDLPLDYIQWLLDEDWFYEKQHKDLREALEGVLDDQGGDYK